jgi:hypothetical protein
MGILQITKIEFEACNRVQLRWHKSVTDEWSLLDELDLAQVDYSGVFVVWRNGGEARPSAVLYVGRGALRYEIDKCRRNRFFGSSADLRITWARVDDARELEAIAAYLYQQLRPVWGEVVTSTRRLATNTPWAA